jgi:hypothetical protein
LRLDDGDDCLIPLVLICHCIGAIKQREVFAFERTEFRADRWPVSSIASR